MFQIKEKEYRKGKDVESGACEKSSYHKARAGDRGCYHHAAVKLEKSQTEGRSMQDTRRGWGFTSAHSPSGCCSRNQTHGIKDAWGSNWRRDLSGMAASGA